HAVSAAALCSQRHRRRRLHDLFHRLPHARLSGTGRTISGVFARQDRSRRHVRRSRSEDAETSFRNQCGDVASGGTSHQTSALGQGRHRKFPRLLFKRTQAAHFLRRARTAVEPGEIQASEGDYLLLRNLADRRESPALKDGSAELVELLYQWYLDGYISPV